ncbi:MAG: zf-TFIIB domain-containing protein [Minicystis sp.]
MVVAAAPAAVAPRCPRCDGAVLEPFPLPSGGSMVRCPRCRGLFCDRKGLAELLEVSRDHPLIAWESPAPARSDKGCPSCADTYLFAVRPSVERDLALGHCAACDGVWVDGGALPRLRALAAAPRPRSVAPAPLRAPPVEPGLRFTFDTPHVNGLAVPVAFLVAIVAHATFFRWLFGLFVNMPLHEIGHATAAWLSGHFAVPLPFFTSIGSTDRSVLVAGTLLIAIAAAILAGQQAKRRYLVWLGGGALLLQAALTLIVPNDRSLRVVTWSGCGGELVLGTLLVVSFYYKMPDRLRWDFMRYAALFFGAYALVHATSFWLDVFQHRAPMPYGSALGGGDDPNGDMNQLVDWGMRPERIAATYLLVGLLGMVIVAGHYAFFLARVLRKKSAV